MAKDNNTVIVYWTDGLNPPRFLPIQDEPVSVDPNIGTTEPPEEPIEEPEDPTPPPPEGSFDPATVPTSEVAGPTILSYSSTSDAIDITYHVEDMSGQHKFDGFYNQYDGFKANDDVNNVGDFYKGHVNTIRVSESLVADAISKDYYINSGSLFNRNTAPTNLEAEAEFNSWLNTLNAAGAQEGQVIGLQLADEPSWTRTELENVIAIGKSILPSWVPLGISITTGTALGWSGNKPIPVNADFVYVNHYPYRLDPDTGASIGIGNTKNDLLGGSTWSLTNVMNSLAAKMETEGVQLSCKIGYTGQGFSGYEGTTSPYIYAWSFPPDDYPLWVVEGLNNFNANTAGFDNRGYQSHSIQWWVWCCRGLYDGTYADALYIRDVPSLQVSQKKVDVFNRAASTVNNVRINRKNINTGVIESIVVANTGNHSITGLPSNESYLIWMESEVNGNYSGSSNFITAETT